LLIDLTDLALFFLGLFAKCFAGIQVQALLVVALKVLALRDGLMDSSSKLG
jgi:hypothetical protein